MYAVAQKYLSCYCRHTIPSHHLTDFQFLHIVVTDFSYRRDLLTTHDATRVTYVTRDVIFVDKQLLSKEDILIENGYGAKRIMTEWRTQWA